MQMELPELICTLRLMLGWIHLYLLQPGTSLTPTVGLLNLTRSRKTNPRSWQVDLVQGRRIKLDSILRGPLIWSRGRSYDSPWCRLPFTEENHGSIPSLLAQASSPSSRSPPQPPQTSPPRRHPHHRCLRRPRRCQHLA